MGVILLENHQRILRQVRRGCFRFNILVTALCLTLALCLNPFTSNESLPDPQGQILQALKNKPLIIGQALNVTDVILEQSKASGVPISLILAVIDVESQFFPYAQSNQGARGLMQLREAVFISYLEKMGLDPRLRAHRFDVSLNIEIGIMYLADLLQAYGNLEKALSHYYCGDPKKGKAYVQKVLRRVNAYGGGNVH